MALLNPPQILPRLAELVYLYLRTAERRTERRATLVALLAPASLGQNDGTSGSRALDDTLRACERIGLVQSDGETIRLHPDLPKWAAARSSTRRSFRRLLRELVFDRGLNVGEWGSQEGARDLTLTLAWYLRQDIYSPPATWDLIPPLQSVQLTQQQQLGASTLVINDTRWGAFTRWAPYLGFAVHDDLDDHRYLIPDPTEAVRDTLDLVCGGSTGEMDLPALLRLLSDELPVVDGGLYRQEVEEHLRPGSYRQFPPGTLTPALGHALRRLEDEAVIRLWDRADSPKVEFSSELGERIVRSHISWTNAVHPDGKSE